MSFKEIQIEDDNLTLLPSLVEQTPGICGVAILEINLSLIDTNTDENICKWKNLREI